MKRIPKDPVENIGKVNGEIEIIGVGYVDEKTKTRKYEVMCHKCGNIYYISLGNFNSMTGKGCVKCHNKTHGMKFTNIYNVWKQMKYRCSCPKKDWSHYKNYCGRGISVCEEWQSFENFYKWAIANGYKEDFYSSGRNKITIDRIDNDGDYCPENCRFVTHQENQWNKRTTKKVLYYGEEYNLKELAAILGIKIDCLKSRIDRGWDMSRWGKETQRRNKKCVK